MSILKNSDSKEEIRIMHMKLWDVLSERDEEFAEEFLHDCLEKLSKNRFQRFLEQVQSLVMTKYFWISIAIGLAIVPTLIFLFSWISLLIEVD